MYGPGALVPKTVRGFSHQLPPETIGFALEFVHHPDSIEYSYHKLASCDGKQNELLGRGNQPVVWLKQKKTAL